MRKLLLYIGFIALAIFTSCGKAKQLLNINVNIPYNFQEPIPAVQGYSVTTRLPGAGLSVPLPAIPVATNSQQYMTQYGTDTGLVITVFLKSLSLQIQSPAGQNFNFLDSIGVYISAPSLPEVLVAYQNSVPANVSTLSLVTDTTINLKSYFIADTVYFRASMHITAVPPGGEVLNTSLAFHMLANPLQ